MEEIEKMLEDLSLNSFEMEPIHWVEVTHVKDPYEFYVRPLKYKPMIKIFESTEPTNKLVPVNIQDLVMFNMGQSGGFRKFIRGRITKIDRVDSFFFECDIFAMDYGFTEKAIPLEYVWDCSQEMANIPALAFNCQLANCYPTGPKGFTSNGIHAFKYFACIEPLKMKVLGRKPHKYLIELVNSIPESIATMLAYSGYSMLGHHNDAISWTPVVGRKRMFFNFKKPKLGTKIHVRVLSGGSLSEFHVAKVSDYEKHLSELKVISFYARREFQIIPAHLIEGTLVCVRKEDNEYERAFIKKVTVPNKSAIVQLVDWGRDEEFAVEKMKYMAKECLRTPVLAIYCKACKDQAWDNGLNPFLTPGFEFEITIKKRGHEFECPYTVDITPVEEFGNEAAALPEKDAEE